MLRVGLTGGYATGKSFVAEELSRLGCHVISADRLGHAALAPGGAAYEPAIALFGRGILAADGTINRKQLASIVFQETSLLQKLNALVHPAVYRLEEQMLREIAAADPGGIAVLEAAILIETGRYTECDKLIVTTCEREVQIARGMKRDGATRDEVTARLDKQMPLDEKKQYADYVIDTSGEKEDTLRQVQGVFEALRTVTQA